MGLIVDPRDIPYMKVILIACNWDQIVRWGKMDAQLIPKEGLQLYSLGDGPLPTQGPTTLYTRSPRAPNTRIL
jgi:hypothetical protein